MDSYLELQADVSNQQILKDTTGPITLTFEEGMPRDRAIRERGHELKIVGTLEHSSRRAISCSSRVRNELIRSL